jgi:hypothetical protein
MIPQYVDISKTSDLFGMSLSNETVIDTEKRMMLRTSSTKSLFSFIPKKKAEKEFWTLVKKQIAKQAGIADFNDAVLIWEDIERTIKFSITSGKEITFGDLNKIREVFLARIFYSGHGAVFSKPAPCIAQQQIEEASITSDPERTKNELVDDFIQFILKGSQMPHIPKKWEVWKAIFVQLNPELMESFKETLQTCLLECLDQFNNPDIGPDREDVYRIFLGNVLALLPYSYPKEGSIVIPQKIDGAWIKATYEIEKIPLNLAWITSPLYAYGLTPTTPGAQPILIFTGTTFPAGDGFAASVLTDFTPGCSVGESVFALGKANIAKWMKDRHNVSLFGQSLGGSLALLTLIEFTEQIGRVDAYNPAGLYPWKWKNAYNEGNINIYMQSNDLVPILGTWPTGEAVHLYKINPNTEGIKPNFLASHIQAFTGQPEVLIEKLDPFKENKQVKRVLLTILHMVLGPILIFVPGICLLILKKLYDALASLIKKMLAIILERPNI